MDDTIFKIMFGAIQAPSGQVAWTTPGTYSWVVPARVFSISLLCVGAGGGAQRYDSSLGGAGGGGGGLRYAKKIAVNPGDTLTIVVGAGVAGATGGNTTISIGSTILLQANGGVRGWNFAGAGGEGSTYDANIGGGNGGSGGAKGSNQVEGGGGGGAGGYSGDGGRAYTPSEPGAGGGGGAGGRGTNSNAGAAGGGVGILGEGASGAAGVNGPPPTAGGPGSGGIAGATQTDPGLYGGGAPGRGASTTTTPGAGGACRIIWGSGRAYPSTNTQDI
jgi:hypothetical protein